MGNLIDVEKDTVLINANEIPKYCYYVKSGRVISYEYSKSGEERIYAFSERDSLVLEESLLFMRPVPVSFRAAVNSKLVQIDRNTLLSEIVNNPEFAIDIIHSVSEKFLSAMEQIRQISSYSATWKICSLLIVFANNYGVPYDGKTLIQEKISQQMISSMLGINRITAVRIIKDLKNTGLIEQINGYYCIRSIDKLKRHMELIENE
ncbi:MAG: Crp/Fnr family transcriptional regulator [Solobacterium sp.]|nr:Crp/Fnr family transcriptional regulator [Solobacterium sp.]